MQLPFFSIACSHSSEVISSTQPLRIAGSLLSSLQDLRFLFLYQMVNLCWSCSFAVMPRSSTGMWSLQMKNSTVSCWNQREVTCKNQQFFMQIHGKYIIAVKLNELVCVTVEWAKIRKFTITLSRNHSNKLQNTATSFTLF